MDLVREIGSLPLFSLRRGRTPGRQQCQNDQDIRVRHAGIVPGHPLHDTVTGIGGCDPCRCFFAFQNFPAEGPVPVKDAILHGVLVFAGGCWR